MRNAPDTLARDTDAADFVWTAREPFDRFYQKAAAALVAVRKALAVHRPLRGREAEFLDLAARVAKADAAAFTRVFTAPPAYAWTVYAFRMTAAALAGRTPEAAPALSRHLEGFKALALGQHWVASCDLEFSAPFAVDPPFALPGTPWVLFGPPAEIAGLAAGRIVVREDGREVRLAAGESSGPFALRRSPVVERDGASIVLSPYPLAAAELDLRGADEAVEAGLGYHAERRDLVLRAFEKIARHAPATWQQFRDVVRVIGLQPPGASAFLAASSADAPGAFVASAVDCPFELGNFFIHEFHHTRMFVLEALAPVLTADPDASVHYSPWRDDRRPLRGLLHALYVHIPVTRYWLAVHAASDPGEAIAGRAADRAARVALQVEPVLETLDRHARFTPEGRLVFDEIVRATREVQSAVRGAGLSGEEPSWEGVPVGGSGTSGRPCTVAESVREHAQRFGASEWASGAMSGGGEDVVILRRLEDAFWSTLYGRWPDAREPIPGYTLLLTVPPDLPVFLRIAVEVCRRQDSTHLVETLVIPDAFDPAFARHVAAAAADWPEGRVRLVQPGPIDRLVRPFLRKASLIHWLQLVAGARETRSTHAVAHDADLFLLEPGFLRSLFETCRDGGYFCVGNERPLGYGAWTKLPSFAHVLALWELMFDMSWLRSGPPAAMRPQSATFAEGEFWFETSLLAQARSAPERIARHRAARLVHFGWVIGGYRKFQQARRRFKDRRFRLLLIRVLIDGFDPEGGPCRVPGLAELRRGLNGDGARVRYEERDRGNYLGFRQELERLLRSDLFPAGRLEEIRAGLAPFDVAYAWRPAEAEVRYGASA